MTKDKLVTAKEDVDLVKAENILQQHKIEKLLITDNENKLVGLITFKDIIKVKQHPLSCKDEFEDQSCSSSRCFKDTFERIEALVNSGVDAIVIDTAHGHSKGYYLLKEKKKFKIWM